jgi:hypothetical protein
VADGFIVYLRIGSSEPVKMFDRSANLATSHIISYQCDSSERWFALIGIWRDPLFKVSRRKAKHGLQNLHTSESLKN